LTGPTLDLAAVATGELSGTASFPAGYQVVAKRVALAVAPGVVFTVGSDFTSSTSFDFVTPSIPNTSLAVEVSASNAAEEFMGFQKAGLSGTASGLALSGPAVPTLTAPADAATAVSGTTAFSWTPYAGGVHLLEAFSNDGPAYIVLTTAATATLPDLPSLGLPLPTGVSFSWRVNALAPVESLDAVTGSAGLLELVASDFTQGVSTSRSFTTSP
jgi:hypothetical protein